MTNHVYWTIDAKLADGKADALNEVCAKCSALTKDNEPGALAYEWWLSEDNSTVHIYERYTDSAAVMAHMGNVGPHLPELMALIVEPKVTMYGSPDETVRGAFADFKPLYMTNHVGGFHRHS